MTEMITDNIFIYPTKIYNLLQATIAGLLMYITINLAIIEVFRHLKQPELGVIVWCIAMVLPFAFQKKFKAYFSKKVNLEFSDKNFCIQNNDSTFEECYNWDKIKAYKVRFSATKITYLTLYLNSGKNKTFLIADDKNQQQAIDQKSAYSIFVQYVSLYNSIASNVKPISVR